LKKIPLGNLIVLSLEFSRLKEKWIEVESNKSSYFPQLKRCFSLLKAPLSFSENAAFSLSV
jgi:hypothetical protein